MLLYLVRHPETEWNKKRILQGWKDSPLTSKGKEIAQDLGRKLQTKNIRVIYSSDLGRCVQTAQLINKSIKNKIIKTHQLRERNFGVFNGKTVKEVEKYLDLSDLHQIAPQGESFNQMKKRVIGFINKLPSRQESLLVVTSYGPLKILLEHFGLDYNDRKILKFLYEIKI